MRKVLILLIMLPGMLYAQVISEDFESGLTGEWLQSGNQRWEADSVFTINGKFTLHHSFDNPESGCDQTGIGINGLKPSLSETKWKFKIRHAYNPSSSNNWSFFLLSDKPPGEMRPGGSVSGYTIGVNLTGYDDTLCLWKIKNGSVSRVISTSINWQYDIGVDSIVSLEVKRMRNGQWEIYITGNSGQMVMVGQGSDEDLFYTGWTGIMYKYSSSQDRKLWIDDIVIDGCFHYDEDSPSVDTVYFPSLDKISILFDEPVLADPAVKCFSLFPGNINPATIINDENGYTLTFDANLENKKYYNLHLSGVCDLAGNCCDTIIESIAPAIPSLGDILISEVMFDPEPAVELPACEYIELHNNSGFDLNTSGLEIEIGEKRYALPARQFMTGQYMLIINKDDSTLMTEYGNILCTANKFNLNNALERLVLVDAAGKTIHGVEYDIEWYRNQLKEYGGWSLEMIDYSYPFAGRVNWSEAVNRSGGTPGSVNSVCGYNPDLDNPALLNIYPSSDRHVKIVFSETMNETTARPESWSLNENMIITIVIADPLMRIFDIELQDKLRQGVIYEIYPEKNIADRAGNILLINDNRFGAPVATESQDIIFNEIMYDPLPGGAEFIEFYNASEKIIDLSDHFVVSYNSETSDTGRITWLSDDCCCLMPGDYFVITDDREAVINMYSTCNKYTINEPGTLPSIPDKEGNLLLYNRNLILIDELHYSDLMHFDMLSITTGISLERISADIPGTVSTNWRSASGTSGYATPGAVNSAADYYEEIVNKGVLSLSSRKISPDNDGFEDYLEIMVKSASDRNLLTVIVYDDLGYPVRTLAENITSGYGSVFIWDGCDNKGQAVREGIYIICSIIIYPGGRPELMKKVCTVVYY